MKQQNNAQINSMVTNKNIDSVENNKLNSIKSENTIISNEDEKPCCKNALAMGGSYKNYLVMTCFTCGSKRLSTGRDWDHPPKEVVREWLKCQ
jgi:hypothetical protein